MRRLGLTKRATGTDLANRRGHRNTLRLFRMCLVWKLIHARYVWPPLQKGRLFDSHTSNIQRAQMKRLALCIVRSKNPILRSPEGRSDYGRCNDKTHYVTICFSGAKRYFASPASLFCILFSGKTEMGPNSKPAKRLLFGADEQRNERDLPLAAGRGICSLRGRAAGGTAAV